MLRRGYNNGDSLPTHGSSGGLGGFSDKNSQGYGGYSGGLSSSGGMYGEPSKYNKRRSGAGFSPLMFAASAMAIFSLILTGLWLSSRGQYRSLLQGVNNAKDARSAINKIQWTGREIDNVQREITKMARRAEGRYGPRIKQLEKENQQFKDERDELREKYESPGKKTDGARLKQRESAYMRQIGLMQQAIRKESKRTVLERFGPGPHQVQMTFVRDNMDYDIVIEMAPLNAVPHAIHLFLEQIEHGLWNGAYFYINTEHVLQAGPFPANGYKELAKGKPSSKKPFEDLQLDTLAFPDYSHEFPHDIWTVGFAGRPGGPDFYINKLDNIEAHGPGGQIQHALEEQGDSCFGRITKGKEHLEVLFKQPTVGGGNEYDVFLQQQVPIVRAIVITPKPGNGSTIDLEELPEPMEFQFARSLRDALEPLKQTLIDNPTIIEVRVDEEDGVDSPANKTSPAISKEDQSGKAKVSLKDSKNVDKVKTVTP